MPQRIESSLRARTVDARISWTSDEALNPVAVPIETIQVVVAALSGA
jgi:hypothetical protein